jgi:autotransporter passenger strand-loop-strand repeat protein
VARWPSSPAAAAGTLVKAGGNEIIEFGGSATGTTVLSGGAIEFVSGGTTAAQFSAGAILAFGAGEVVSGVNVSGGVLLEFLLAAARSAARSARAAS